MKINWIVLWEAVKEPLRLVVLGLITWVITYIVPQVSNPTWAAVILLVLRGIDSYLHEQGKATDNPALTTGLTRF